VLLALALLCALVVVSHAAQKLILGQPAGGGGRSTGGGRVLVGSIPASPAGTASGGAYRLTGGFTAAAQVWGDSFASESPAAAAAGMVTALTAVPAAGGAQITFTLSAPALVELRVLNIAGRLVRTITPGRDCEAGLNTFAWTGTSDAGLRAPEGRYLVEVRARTADGSASRCLTAVQLAR
jgi:hypothetical protein